MKVTLNNGGDNVAAEAQTITVEVGRMRFVVGEKGDGCAFITGNAEYYADSGGVLVFIPYRNSTEQT